MRAFLGTLLGASNQGLYGQLAESLVRRHPQILRPIPEDSAHLTYGFMAALDDDQRSAALSAVSRVADRHRAIDIHLAAPRVVLAGPVPRLICAEVTLGGDLVRRLADDLVAALRATRRGVDVRPMKSAHVTIARFRKHAARADAALVAATLAEGRTAGAGASDRLDRVQLVGSTLTPHGPVYEVVAASRLAD